MAAMRSEEDSSPLLDLPHVPLLRILCFLDVKSLRKVQSTCRSLLTFTDRNRTRLALTSIHRIHIKRVKNRYGANFVALYILKNADGQLQRMAYFPQTEKEESKHDIFANYYCVDIDRSQVEKITFYEWMASHFRNVHIGQLQVEGIPLISDGISNLEEAFKRKKIHAKIVVMIESWWEPNPADLIARFAMLFSPEELMLVCEKKTIPFCMTPLFMECISSLKCFYYNCPGLGRSNQIIGNTTQDVPSTSYQFPPTFHLTSGAFLPMSIVRKALQEWSRNRLAIKHWVVSLPLMYSAKKIFLYALQLPSEPTENDKAFRIRNCADEELTVAPYPNDHAPHGMYPRWRIAVDAF